MSITVTRRGQITLPKPVRERLGLTPGCAVAFHLDQAGHVVLTRADEAPLRRQAVSRACMAWLAPVLARTRSCV